MDGSKKRATSTQDTAVFILFHIDSQRWFPLTVTAISLLSEVVCRSKLYQTTILMDAEKFKVIIFVAVLEGTDKNHVVLLIGMSEQTTLKKRLHFQSQWQKYVLSFRIRFRFIVKQVFKFKEFALVFLCIIIKIAYVQIMWALAHMKSKKYLQCAEIITQKCVSM